MHTLEPAADHELAGQEVHALELAAGLYVLFVHVVQAVAAPYAKVPAGRLSTEIVRVPRMYVSRS